MDPHPDFELLVDSHLQLLADLYGNNSLAPITGYLNRDGEILGLAITAESSVDDLSMEEVMKPVYDRLEQLYSDGELLAYVVFRAGAEDPDYIPAVVEDAKSIVGFLGHVEGVQTRVIIRFRRDESGCVILDTPAYEQIEDDDAEEE